MSAAAGRPINWNVLTVDSRAPERVPRQLEASQRAREIGGRVVALTMPVLVPMNMSFLDHCALFLMPGWGDVLTSAGPRAHRKLLRTPAVRAGCYAQADSKDAGVFRRLANFGRYVIGDTYSQAERRASRAGS